MLHDSANFHIFIYVYFRRFFRQGGGFLGVLGLHKLQSMKVFALSCQT